jgi:pimeloyl-ACP methyl ester carboxylesterase
MHVSMPIHAAAVGALVLSLAACGGGESSTTSVVPRLDESSCPYKLDPSQTLGNSVRCGVMVVAQDRRAPAGATVSVPFIVFKSAGSGLAPVIYLTGGPGQDWGDTVSQVKLGSSPGFDGGAKLPRDEVLIEQRGALLSKPALACNELPWGAAMFRDFKAALTSTMATVKGCAEGWLAKGVQPQAFTTDDLAADVNDLRALLGYDKVVLNGVSYGTMWALAVLRDHPGTVDRMVLDSVVAQSVPPFKSGAKGVDDSLIALSAACAAQPACAAAYPGLDARLSALFGQLNNTVVPWTLGPGGQLSPAVAAGVLFTVAQFLPESFPGAVALLERLVSGEVPVNGLNNVTQEQIVALARLAFDDLAGPVAGQYLSIVCADNATVSADELKAAVAQVRPALQPVAQGQLESLVAHCGAWPYRKDLPARSFAPVVSNVPTLILSGDLDPSTPPVWAQEVAKTLSGSTWVRFPARSHSVQTSSECATGLAQAFMAGKAINPACAAAETLTFTLP